MANPIIFWNDGTVSVKPTSTVSHNLADLEGAWGSADSNSIRTRNLIPVLQSGRSIDRTRTEFALQLYAPGSQEFQPGESIYVAAFCEQSDFLLFDRARVEAYEAGRVAEAIETQFFVVPDGGRAEVLHIEFENAFASAPAISVALDADFLHPIPDSLLSVDSVTSASFDLRISTSIQGTVYWRATGQRVSDPNNPNPSVGDQIERLDTSSFAARLDAPLDRTTDPIPDDKHGFIYKKGIGNVVEIMASTNAIELAKPPQSGSFPAVSKKWNTFPKTSVRGDFLGSSSRPATGRINLNIDNLSNQWIRDTWEPFREYIATGGVFCYAIDYEADPTNVAYCFAAANVPVPNIKAGGFGSVSASIGVAVI